MKLFELKMNPINLGLWISPQGNIIKTTTHHAADIIENPEKFGVTFDLLKPCMINMVRISNKKVTLVKN